ncbi:MAG: hypothetical protein JWP89_862 [Schlesneria sp.]|nr:hypothetical protein [Schlesneria sp.]
MPRIAKPRKWKDKYFVTEAGGKLKILCPISDGIAKARRELKKHLNEVEQEKRQHKLEPQNLAPKTLAEIAAEFLKFKRSSKAERTFEFYSGYLKRFTEWYGHLTLTEASLSHGTDYLSKLRDLKLGSVSVNHHTRAAKAVLNYAMDCGWIAKNPWRRLPMLPEIGRRRVVTDAEFELLLATCDYCRGHGDLARVENASLMKDILRVLRFTALRPGEIRKLRWDHLRLDENLIVIPANEHKTGTTTSKPQDRVVPFLEDVKSIFEDRKLKYGHHPRVFANLNGEEWHDDVFSRRFNRLRKRAGLDKPDDQYGERICWYSLRHSRLTEVATLESWDLHVIAAYAGHSPAMTQRYVHVNKDTLTHALNAGHRKRTESERPN